MGTVNRKAVRPPNVRAVAAAVIGNALEWYDFTVFGFMTVVIAQLFFPSHSDYSSILLTTATFGVAFVMRPVGGIVLGLYADRAGRKAALTLVMPSFTTTTPGGTYSRSQLVFVAVNSAVLWVIFVFVHLME